MFGKQVELYAIQLSLRVLDAVVSDDWRTKVLAGGNIVRKKRLQPLLPTIIFVTGRLVNWATLQSAYRLAILEH